MLKIFLLLLIVFYFCLCFGLHLPSDNSSDVGNLLFTHIIFRHGDRNPERPYPNDPYKDATEHWPNGFGRLTNKGMNQMFEFGKFLRRRYSKLLPDNIHPTDLIYVRSTDYDRTIMSAQLVLAAMFPPIKDQIWNEELLWQPIPIRTLPLNIDLYFFLLNHNCDRFDDMYKKNLETDRYKDWRLKNKHIYKNLEQQSGKSLKMPVDVLDFYDNIKIERIKNKTLPDWVKQSYDDIKRLGQFEMEFDLGTREMSRLKAGYLIGEIFERFLNRTKGPLSPDRRIWLYSAHDITISHIMIILGFSNIHFPPYSASVMFDLYELNGTHYVQIFYRENSEEDVQPLHIKGCGIKCSLDKLYEILAPMIPTQDFEIECHLNN